MLLFSNTGKERSQSGWYLARRPWPPERAVYQASAGEPPHRALVCSCSQTPGKNAAKAAGISPDDRGLLERAVYQASAGEPPHRALVCSCSQTPGKNAAKAAGISPDDRGLLKELFIKRVRENLHIVLWCALVLKHRERTQLKRPASPRTTVAS